MERSKVDCNDPLVVCEDCGSKEFQLYNPKCGLLTCVYCGQFYDPIKEKTAPEEIKKAEPSTSTDKSSPKLPDIKEKELM